MGSNNGRPEYLYLSTDRVDTRFYGHVNHVNDEDQPKVLAVNNLPFNALGTGSTGHWQLTQKTHRYRYRPSRKNWPILRLSPAGLCLTLNSRLHPTTESISESWRVSS